MPADHARLSPSGATKWMGCPASLAAERGKPDSRSDAAQEGTAAHSVAETVLRTLKRKTHDGGRCAASAFVGETVERWLITEDMAEPIQTYIDTVLAEAAGKTLHVEQRVDFSHVVGVRNSFGTADAVIINGDEIQIHDLKFGRGVRVDAENNPQLMIYALGALKLFDLGTEFNTIKLFIHQPRLNHVSEWSLSAQELKRFGRQVRASAKKAIELYELAANDDCGALPPESFNPSEKACRWCKAAGTCAAYASHVYELVANDFVDLDAAEFTPVKALHLTDDQLVAANANIELIEAWCSKVKKEVYNRLINGGGLPGMKLVQGRPGNRKWSDMEAAEDVLARVAHADEIYRQTLITPTQAEKVLKHDAEAWQAVQSLIVRPDGAPVVVSASDPRPAITLDGASDFEAIQ